MTKKILIISNNCLSKYNSNGRTLLNLLGGFDTTELYQFYVTNEVPQEKLCEKFLRITDSNVIKSYFKRSKKSTIFEEPVVLAEGKPSHAANSSYGKKTVFKSFVRDWLWNTSKWIRRQIIDLVEKEGIKCILLQAGDNVFLHRIARKVAQKCKLPLLVYNTEDYYFKEYDYMRKRLRPGIAYKLYHRSFCKEFKKLLCVSTDEVYNCDGLKRLYNETFAKQGKAIYAATEFLSVSQVRDNGFISYAGNLGCGRHFVLMEVANALQQISQELRLDVYGPENDEKVVQDLKACKGINFHGFVSYDKVCDVIKNSRLLIHVESFDEYYQKDTRFAFSTKLADYSSSGVPMFICAPKSSETYTYMTDNDIAFVAENEANISMVLREALTDEMQRKEKTAKALSMAKLKHNYTLNGNYFKEIVEGIINDGNQKKEK